MENNKIDISDLVETTLELKPDDIKKILCEYLNMKGYHVLEISVDGTTDICKVRLENIKPRVKTGSGFNG